MKIKHIFFDIFPIIEALYANNDINIKIQADIKNYNNIQKFNFNKFKNNNYSSELLEKIINKLVSFEFDRRKIIENKANSYFNTIGLILTISTFIYTLFEIDFLNLNDFQKFITILSYLFLVLAIINFFLSMISQLMLQRLLKLMLMIFQMKQN
ncbi:MAG: hypothetical protein ACFFG0_47425 [Candidatus Thorarchaeota archaeon]